MMSALSCQRLPVAPPFRAQPYVAHMAPFAWPAQPTAFRKPMPRTDIEQTRRTIVSAMLDTGDFSVADTCSEAIYAEHGFNSVAAPFPHHSFPQAAAEEWNNDGGNYADAPVQGHSPSMVDQHQPLPVWPSAAHTEPSPGMTSDACPTPEMIVDRTPLDHAQVQGPGPTIEHHQQQLHQLPHATACRLPPLQQRTEFPERKRKISEPPILYEGPKKVKSESSILDTLFPGREDDDDADIVNMIMDIEQESKPRPPPSSSLPIDIRANTLNISTNPRDWTPTDVRLWLFETMRFSGSISAISAVDSKWDLTGLELCGLSREEFNARCASDGDVIWTALQAWLEEYERFRDRCSYMQSPASQNTPLSEAFPTYQPQRKSPTIVLWQFIALLLADDRYKNVVQWVDEPSGIFKVENSKELARLWGQRKGKDEMNYDKLSRSLRQYYLKKILKKTTRPQRLVYQFVKPYPHRNAPAGARGGAKPQGLPPGVCPMGPGNMAPWRYSCPYPSHRGSPGSPEHQHFSQTSIDSGFGDFLAGSESPGSDGTPLPPIWRPVHRNSAPDLNMEFPDGEIPQVSPTSAVETAATEGGFAHHAPMELRPTWCMDIPTTNLAGLRSYISRAKKRHTMVTDNRTSPSYALSSTRRKMAHQALPSFIRHPRQMNASEEVDLQR